MAAPERKASECIRSQARTASRTAKPCHSSCHRSQTSRGGDVTKPSHRRATLARAAMRVRESTPPAAASTRTPVAVTHRPSRPSTRRPSNRSRVATRASMNSASVRGTNTSPRGLPRRSRTSPKHGWIAAVQVTIGTYSESEASALDFLEAFSAFLSARYPSITEFLWEYSQFLRAQPSLSNMNA
jgi:hypothetical protein